MTVKSWLTKAIIKQEYVIVALLLLYVWPWIFPQYTLWAADESLAVTSLPETILREPDEVRYVTMTAYSSTPDQTDDTPFTTANGTHVRWGIAAANFLQFHSRLRVPEYFGEEMFTVEDRMHPRFSDRIDVWFPTRAEAKAFGRQRLKVEIWHY